MAQKTHTRPERVVIVRIPAFDRVSAFILLVTFIGRKQDRIFVEQIADFIYRATVYYMAVFVKNLLNGHNLVSV